MGIFGMIKDAIWGHDAAAPGQAAPSSTATPQQNTPSAPAAQAPTPAAPVAAAAPAAPKRSAEEILTEKAAASGQKLNWDTSIVDLLKLLELDSSHSARVQLAHEFGYTGDVEDSATMNIWLHKKVMENLAS